MGFWNGLKRVAQGKPVFMDEEGQNKGETIAPRDADVLNSAIDQDGRKIIPEVLLENCKSRLNGSEVEVTVWITNISAVEIELDKIILLGTKTELDRVLAPNEAREIRLYKGEAVKNDDNEMAKLQYKRRDNGDYFQADFIIEFNYDSQGFYHIEELRPVRPIRDI